MNRHETQFTLKCEAKLKYLYGEFQVRSPGDFVRCAVTGQPVRLDELRYWSVELQEPYANAEISLRRFTETRSSAPGRQASDQD